MTRTADWPRDRPDAHAYEIHVTVDRNRMIDQQISQFPDSAIKHIKQARNAFNDAVAELDGNVTALSISNIVWNDGNPKVYYEWLTQSTVKSSYDEAFDSMRKIAFRLASAGCPVIRQKIETVPWHPATHGDVVEGQSQANYFESHVKFNDHPNQTTYDLHAFIRQTGIPLYQSMVENKNVWTYRAPRDYSFAGTLGTEKRRRTWEEFRKELDCYLDTIEVSTNWRRRDDVQEIEFALYDSNRALDSDWMEVNSYANEQRIIG